MSARLAAEREPLDRFLMPAQRDTRYSVESMTLRYLIAAFCVLVVTSCIVQAQSAARGRRIIDVHLHAIPAGWVADSTPVNPVTGQPSAARTGADLLPETLREMDEHNVQVGILSGPLPSVRQWVASAPGRFIGAPQVPMTHTTTLALERYLPAPAEVREAIEAGWVGAIGEITAQYAGLVPNDSVVEPYLMLADAFDLPVGIHTGRGTVRIIGREEQVLFRADYGNPMWVNEVLARYPRLRVYLMHAGYPYLDDTIALMGVYTDVYADVSRMNWSIPRSAFHDYLKRLIDAGFGDRLMFGSDGVGLPEAIGLAIDGIESADFLTEQQKDDIFYNNAVRFFRLGESQKR